MQAAGCRFFWRARRAVAAAILLGAAGSQVAPSAAAANAPGNIAAELKLLQQRDELVQSIGWKLITGNARFCAHTRPAIGLLLQDVAAFGGPGAVRDAMGLQGDIAVQARAAGSPAARAGLPVFAEVLAIDGQSMLSIAPAGGERWQRLAGLHRQVEEVLAASGEVEIAWRGEENAVRSTALVGQAACVSSFEVIAGSRRATANGVRVAIGSQFTGFDYPESLLAAAIAHELAHNLLGHPAWLDANGRKQGNIRITEREADRLMPWLLANGGYDPAAAEQFMRKWGPGNDGGLFRGRTHDGWDERADFIAAELPLLRSSMTSGTAADRGADWAADFRRDIRDQPYSAAIPSSSIE